MTEYNKIKNYYQSFDEWSRLDTPSGKLEFELTLSIILKYLNEGNEILDLGGGPGRYTIELAKMGYVTHLADLSDKLLDEARKKVKDLELEKVKTIQQVNAVDLSLYKDKSFDMVLILGPLYHLTKNDEREKCISEVYRVLKSSGIVIASFIPYLSGSIGIIDRFFRSPNQVSRDNLAQVFRNGIFNNHAESGFQEGYYPEVGEIKALFKSTGFEHKLIRSIRSFGYNREDKLFELREKNKEMYDLMIQLINETASREAMINSCGHALFIGSKKGC